MAGPRPGDVRLRRRLDQPIGGPEWPCGFVVRGLRLGDERGLHALLAEVLGDVVEPSFEPWWEKRLADAEFDTELCFLVFDAGERLVAAACCWTSGFVKELAVHPSVRRRGVGEALMRHTFQTFRARGCSHVDLKTNLAENADAARLYRRLGMIEVAWEG